MVTVQTAKNEVNELKQRLNPDDKHVIIHQTHFAGKDDPHGFLGGSNFHILTRDGKETKWFEPVDSESELNDNREFYDKMISNPHNNFMKAPDHPYHSFESFLESHRCTCGRHGVDGKQPFKGQAQEILECLKEWEKLSPEEKQRQNAETLEWYKEELKN